MFQTQTSEPVLELLKCETLKRRGSWPLTQFFFSTKRFSFCFFFIFTLFLHSFKNWVSLQEKNLFCSKFKKAHSNFFLHVTPSEENFNQKILWSKKLNVVCLAFWVIFYKVTNERSHICKGTWYFCYSFLSLKALSE